MRCRLLLSFVFVLVASANGGAVQWPPAGAPLDTSKFTFTRRLLNVRKGLNIVTLDGAALAHSRSDDLRIVDVLGRQVPYVIEEKATNLEMRLPGPALLESSTPKESLYALRLPFASLPAGSLVLATSATVFERSVKIERNTDRGRSPETITAIQWRSTSGTPEPLTIALPSKAGRDLVLSVDEGDNSRLPITGATLFVPTRSLRFFAGDPRLRLLYGNNSMDAPRYDIALIGSEIGNSAANVARLAPESASATAAGARRTGERTFWIALVASVVVLLALLVRLVAGERSDREHS